MITVKKSSNIISISGHANFDEHGKDIVCASVSSIVYTTVNAIFSFDEKSINFSDDGKMRITVINQSKETDILINNMFCLLSELENKYPKNLKICKGE